MNKQHRAPIFVTATDFNAYARRSFQQMKVHLKEILSVQGERTMKNTLIPLNNLYIALTNLEAVANLYAKTHPKKALRTAAEEAEARASKYATRLSQNKGLYKALCAVDRSKLPAKAARFCEKEIADYERMGIDKDRETQKRLAEINAKLTTLGQEFEKNIASDTRSIKILPEQLAGMPEDFFKSHLADEDGYITVTTDPPDYFPVITFADSSLIRKDLYTKFYDRGYPKNEAILSEVFQLRQEYAELLGHASWADYKSAGGATMMSGGDHIAEFIDQVVGVSRQKAEADLAIFAARKEQDLPGEELGIWDYLYLEQKLVAENYDVDQKEVRRYFDLSSTINGILGVIEELYGVEIFHVIDAPVWHPSVKAYDVHRNGELMGHFYLDMHPRPDKYKHQAEFPIMPGVKGVQLPVCALICNYPEPVKGSRTPISHDQVHTLFHEFGHLMHELIGGDQEWITQSGITCEWDFVEVPSILFEEWSFDYEVISKFSAHEETGEPIPAELLEKIKRANSFARGIFVMRQMTFAALSLAYHLPENVERPLNDVLEEVWAEYNPFPHVKGTHLYTTFVHLLGYGAMYITYMWSQAIVCQFVSQFKENGMMNRETAQRYANEVIGRGGSIPALQMIKNFTGEDFNVTAFEAWLKE